MDETKKGSAEIVKAYEFKNIRYPQDVNEIIEDSILQLAEIMKDFDNLHGEYFLEKPIDYAPDDVEFDIIRRRLYTINYALGNLTNVLQACIGEAGGYYSKTLQLLFARQSDAEIAAARWKAKRERDAKQ